MGAHATHRQLKERSVGRIPPLPSLTFDPDLSKFNHLVPCGQGYDSRSLVTIGLELAPGSCSQTYIFIYLYIYRRRRKHNFTIRYGRLACAQYLTKLPAYSSARHRNEKLRGK